MFTPPAQQFSILSVTYVVDLIDTKSLATIIYLGCNKINSQHKPIISQLQCFRALIIKVGNKPYHASYLQHPHSDHTGIKL